MSRLERLLDTVANRPAGEKVNIPAIVRAFTPTQAETIAAVEHLINTGRLDRETLRPPKAEACAETQTDRKCLVTETPADASDEVTPTEPPARRVAASGGGDVRKVTSPPIDLDRLLQCFSDQFETLRVVAMRFGARSPQKIVRYARMLHQRGLVEQSPPTNGRPFLLWRRANSQPQNIPENIPAEEQMPAPDDHEVYDAIANIAFAFGNQAPKERPKGKAPPTMAERARRFETARANEAIGCPPATGPESLLQFFRPHWEKLGVVAARWGEGSAFKLRRPAQRLRDLGLLEFQQLDPQCLWRLASSNTKHSVSSRQREETPRSVGCDEGTSGGKKPIPDEAGPTQVEPAPIVAPLARARPAAPKVDIKVNERRDPTQRPETPEMDSAERERIKAARSAQSYKRRVRTRAQNLIDTGQQGGSKGRNYEVRGAMKELQENADAQARFLDPVEQAKTVIRQGGWNCFAATVRDGPADHYYIGTRVVPEAELLAFAERLRTERRRRA